jgi:hypothetical protein
LMFIPVLDKFSREPDCSRTSFFPSLLIIDMFFLFLLIY